MPSAQTSTVPYALVVDDDALILTDAAQILEDAGFRPLTAMHADEAIGLMEQHADGVAVLFTDVDMPGEMNGFELARLTAERWPDVAILVASGAAEVVDGALPNRATFLRKPFSAEVVHSHLQELLPDGKKPEPLKHAR